MDGSRLPQAKYKRRASNPNPSPHPYPFLSSYRSSQGTRNRGVPAEGGWAAPAPWLQRRWGCARPRARQRRGRSRARASAAAGTCPRPCARKTADLRGCASAARTSAAAGRANARRALAASAAAKARGPALAVLGPCPTATALRAHGGGAGHPREAAKGAGIRVYAHSRPAGPVPARWQGRAARPCAAGAAVGAARPRAAGWCPRGGVRPGWGGGASRPHAEAASRLCGAAGPACPWAGACSSSGWRRVRHFRASQWRAEAGPSLHRTSRLRRWTVTAAEPPTCHRVLLMRQRLHTV
jgi:hypothetical protein